MRQTDGAGGAAVLEGRRILVQGTVQGVGFRPWVYRLASDTGVTGRVRNDATGVTIDAFGTTAALEAFELRLRESPPPAARVRAVTSVAAQAETVAGFEIAATETGGRARVTIPADLATCDECLAEIVDPSNRRYRYPFTNCTNCGPRFTIATAVPYDRPRTSMAAFTMCPACRREYDTPSDRRFHAQPNACPECGPRLVAMTADGAVAPGGDAVRLAAEALRHGRIVALKGIGGFHLACDATDDAAVARLRARKHREEKPLAVMVASVDEAARVAVVGAEARRLLAGPERPIVLLDRRPESGLAAGIAPGNPQVGLVLPYSPLHHLLMADVGRPLVMTSGNVSDEPIATANADALARLSGIADLFLVHDREIVTAADDSVARVIAGAPVLLRRSRGYVPRAIPLAEAVERPVLAVGGLLKNACCVLTGHDAYLGPHIGDLDHLSAYQAFETSVRRMVEFLGVTPEVVAYDLHPGYQSTWFAKQWRGVTHVGVQHHHAHIAAVMAEHGVAGPVTGVAYDGTGFGVDGTAWGGEIPACRPRRHDAPGDVPPAAARGRRRGDQGAVADRAGPCRRRMGRTGADRASAALRRHRATGRRRRAPDGRSAPAHDARARRRPLLRRRRRARAPRDTRELRRAGGHCAGRRGGRGGSRPVPVRYPARRQPVADRSAPGRPRYRRRPVASRGAGSHRRALPQDHRRRDGGGRRGRCAPRRARAGRPGRRVLSERVARRGRDGAPAGRRDPAAAPGPPGDGGLALGQAMVAHWTVSGAAKEA